MIETLKMRPLRELVAFERAHDTILTLFPPTRRAESAVLEDAMGRVAAGDHKAPYDVPHFDRSAMDGYAVKAADTDAATETNPTKLRLRGAIHAGPQSEHDLKRGECFQIATGAPVPKTADAVLMVEHTIREGDNVFAKRPVKPKENISPRGSDLRAGDVAVAKGSRLNAPRVAVLAACGLATATVYDRPKIGLVSTGSELRRPGQNLKPGLIYDSNTPSLDVLLKAHGATVEKAGIVPDEPRLLRKTLERLAGSDLVLVTGSSSAGERDYLVEVVQELGTITFHGVHVKPGKPLLLADVKGTPVLGLAGNPASCLLMAQVLLVPALRRFQHLEPDATRPVGAKLGHDLASPAGKRHFVPVRLSKGEAHSVYKESDATTSLGAADGYIEIAEATERVPRGADVEVHLF